MEKTCRTCYVSKDLGEFYVDKSMKDNHYSACKECVRKRHKEYNKKPSVIQKDRERRRGRKDKKRVVSQKRYYQTHKTQSHFSTKKSMQKNMMRVKVRRQLRTALDNGMLIKPDMCQKCGKICKPQSHHEDYNNPLEVIWLCPLCHGKAHWKKESA